MVKCIKHVIKNVLISNLLVSLYFRFGSLKYNELRLKGALKDDRRSVEKMLNKLISNICTERPHMLEAHFL